MSSYVKLLYPGMNLKRWLVLILLGITLISLGIAYLITQVYRTQPFPEWVGYITLQFIDRPVRGIMFIAIGAHRRKRMPDMSVVEITKPLSQCVVASGWGT